VTWQEAVEGKRRQSLMARQQSVPVGTRNIIVDIAFKQNVSAEDRASRFIEQADGSWRMSWGVNDSEDPPSQVNFIAFIDKVGKRARVLFHRLCIDAVAISQARAASQERPCLGCLDRWIAKDVGLLTMAKSTPSHTEMSDVVVVAMGCNGDQVRHFAGQLLEKVRTKTPSPIDHARAFIAVHKVEAAALAGGQHRLGESKDTGT